MIPVPEARIPTQGRLAFMAYRGIKKRDGKPHYHRGIDFPAPRGTPVVAAAGGTVLRTVDSYTPGFRGYGKCVVVRSPAGIYYFYAHLDRIDVAAGDAVAAGQQLGTVGSTKYSEDDPAGSFLRSGPHLHFEVSRTPYPKAAEAPRMDPVAELRNLGAYVPAWVAPAVRTVAKAATGGAGFLLLGAALALTFNRKK